MLPVIGMVPLYDDKLDSLWMLPGYPEGLAAAGAVGVTLPLTTDPDHIREAAGRCDGLLFTGGHDVDPALYGAEKSGGCEILCPRRDSMEKYLLELALADDLPVLGICRGCQLLNVLLGGDLYQDLPSQLGTKVIHRMEKPYNRPQHPVKLTPDSPLAAILGRDSLEVNSCHHQGIKTLSPRLRSMAQAEDGLVEAWYMPGRPFFQGVQWHPEMFYCQDQASRDLLAAFVRACRR